MPRRLVITNGDVAVSRLAKLGIEGEFLPWRDALHDGPVPTGLVLEALSLVRAQFLAEEFGQNLPALNREFAARNATARNHGQYDTVELWFEHDLYDQLQLIEILSFFHAEGRTEGLLLVQADDYLGTMPEDALKAAAATAVPIGAAETALAVRAWSAFGAKTPEGIAALAKEPTPTLPHLGPAFARLIQELPAVGSGLSLTEERILAALTPGPRTVAELFAAIQTQESARFLGDASFFRRLDRLAFAPQPLVAGLEFPATRFAPDAAQHPDYRAYAAARLRIMENGRLALAGRFDHVTENAVERWLGGTHLSPAAMWRRDAAGALVTPGEPGAPRAAPALRSRLASLIARPSAPPPPKR